jgi:DNA invertase Pin-like site-specific DNA recombinase
MRVGYLRESASEPLVPEAETALEAAGCVRVVIESTGKRGVAPGPALKALMARLQPGDSIVVLTLDHMAGEVARLLELLAELSRAGIRLEALSGEINTEHPGVDGAIRALSAFAQRTERLPRAKVATDGGMARGRPRRLVDGDIERARQLIDGGDKPIREVARELGVSRATLYRSLRQT